jgi:hypothetical protein
LISATRSVGLDSNQLKESAEMADLDELVAAINAGLTGDERERAVVYLNDGLMPAGNANVSGRDIVADHPYILAFVDREPGANWMHPCRYLLIDPANNKIVSIDGDRPPAFGMLPQGWRIVAHPAGLEGWKLMPIAP